MNFTTFFSQLIALLKSDSVATLLPPLMTFLQNVGSNTDSLNIAAQLAALQVNLLAALPTLEHDLVTGIAPLLEQLLAAAAVSAQKTTTTATAAAA